jgi:hypothetical protein
MANGKIPGVRNLSMKETRELLKLAWVRDEELSAGSGSDARVLPDGRVILVLQTGGSGTLYPSRESLAELNRRCAETVREIAEKRAKGIVHPAQELLPPIDDFLRDVEAHAKSLGPRLRIPDAVLDGTPESLDAVDKALKRIPWAKRQVPDLVTPLVAYLGEVMRKGSGGRWSTSQSPGHENEPMITASGGRLFQPFASVFIPMIEPSKRVPLRSSVGVTVTYRPGAGPPGTLLNPVAQPVPPAPEPDPSKMK